MKYKFEYLFTALILILICNRPVMAQTPAIEKKKAFVTLKYIVEDGKGRVHFRVYTKDSMNINPVRYTIVNLFLKEESKWGMMGNITSDSFGEGAVTLRDRFATRSHSMPEYNLIGSLKNDPRYQDIQTKITIKPATLELSLYQNDSVRFAKATLKERDSSGAWVPVPGIKVDFFAQKYFTLLPSVTTDENGQALLEIPNGLKVADDGKVKIVAMINENNYGNLIASAEESRGRTDVSMSIVEKLLSILAILGVLAVIISFFRELFKGRSTTSS